MERNYTINQCLRLLTLVVSLILVSPVWSNAKGTGPEDGLSVIRGFITTSDGSPAAEVTVQLHGTKRFTTTAEDGSFIIRNLRPGTYVLEVSLVGYDTYAETITTESDKTATVKVRLQVSDKQLEEVVVKTIRLRRSHPGCGCRHRSKTSLRIFR